MIPIASPCFQGNEVEYLLDCVQSGYVSNGGDYVNMLETEAGRVVNTEYVVATMSGTTALFVALKALGIGQGDKVAIPAITYIATANAVTMTGAEPYLIDINLSNLTMNTLCLEEALSEIKIDAIMPVHLLGACPDMYSIIKLGQLFDIPVVADAACALDYETYEADFTVFSLNATKTITAGTGGLLITNKDELYLKARDLAGTCKIGDEYMHYGIGYNLGMSNIHAAIGLAQLEHLDHNLRLKDTLYDLYYDKLVDVDGIYFFNKPETPWLTAIYFATDSDYLDLVQGALAHKGVTSRVLWRPIHLQAPYYELETSSLEVSEMIWRRSLLLPSGVALKPTDIEDICEIIKGAI